MLDTVNDYIEANLTHSVHTSERKSFRGCRRRWSWIFRDFYYPTITAKPLEFGVAFHKAMEELYNPELWANNRHVAYQLARVAFKGKTHEQKEAYLDANGTMDPEVEQDYKERVSLGLGMLDYYYKTVMPKYDIGFKPIAVEKKFEVPIVNPDTGEQLWCKCKVCWHRYAAWTRELPLQDNGKPHPWTVKDEASARAIWMGLPVTYGGRIDALMEDENGDYWIFDWKTAARLSTGEENNTQDDYLLLEDQITSYVWALSLVLQIRVKGFVYVEIKKAVPGEPEPLTRRYKGRLYSTNKQMDYDWELYQQTVAENDSYAYENGEYDEFIEHLKQLKFHLRHQVHRSREELLEASKNIWLEACDMTDPNLRIYPSAGRFSCGSCAFSEPCLGTNRGEDVEYYLESMYDKRKRHYWEDAEQSTDKTGRG